MKLRVLLWLLVFFSMSVAAQATGRENCDSVRSKEMRRPIKSEYALEWGWMNAKSTYLSPLPYSGKQIAVTGRWSKVFNHFNNHAVMEFDTRISMGDMLNPAQTAEMLAGTFDFGWGLAWRPELPSGWTATLGGRIGIYAGALYLTRNSNNPVTAIGSPGLDLTASASRSFRIGKLPVTISDRVRIPTLSAFFCPQFGETYYEIWLGNRRGLVHCGWWGNAGGVDNLLQAKLHLGKCSLLLGWRFEYRGFQANHLFTSVRNSVFSVGIDF